VEQIHIVKSLDLIKHLEIADNKPHKIGIYTERRTNTDSIKNASNDNNYLEEIRNRIITLCSSKWTIGFKWNKAHAGKIGNELADRFAKGADMVKDILVVFDKFPKITP